MRYFKPIVLYACLGTAISTIVVAFTLHFSVQLNITGSFQPSLAELLTFGALISATDPVSTLAVFEQKHVDPQLFYLVFGESVLNDAVGLVLFNTLAKFVGEQNTLYNSSKGFFLFLFDFVLSFIGSLCLGLLSGIMAAYLLKVVDMRQTRVLELSSYILIVYVPFFAAEILPFSGIVTSLFTGVGAKQYAKLNLSPQTAEDADAVFHVIAHLAETSIFLELGLSVFSLGFSNFHLQFVLVAVFGCLLGRLLNIYPITWLFNCRIRNTSKPESISQHEDIDDLNLDANYSNGIIFNDQKVDMNTAHMLWFSGLRGAVAYACAKSFPNIMGNRAPMVVTTMSIVLLTVFLLGGTTECALNLLKIEMNVDMNMNEEEDQMQNRLLDKFGEHLIIAFGTFCHFVKACFFILIPSFSSKSNMSLYKIRTKMYITLGCA